MQFSKGTRVTTGCTAGMISQSVYVNALYVYPFIFPIILFVSGLCCVILKPLGMVHLCLTCIDARLAAV